MLSAVIAAQVGPNGRVMAFEPDARNLARTLQNLKLNGSPAQVELA